MGKIPEGWLPYAPIGNQVPGTRFIAFKVPLREAFVDKLQADDRFTIGVLLDKIPDLGLVIDLTHTTKYYNKREFLDRGVDYVKIQTPGQIVPPQHLVERFFEVVDYYLDSHKNDNSLIGVHCTHGVNRTGYMLCRYLIQRLGYSFNEAVEAVGKSRGHSIRRIAYIKNLGIHEESVDKKPLLNINIIERAQSEDSEMKEIIHTDEANLQTGGTSRNPEGKSISKTSRPARHKNKSRKAKSKTEMLLDEVEEGWTKVSVRKKRHRNRNRDKV